MNLAGPDLAHTFGGDWTEDKLEALRRYFSAYAKALKNQKFAKLYIDAFAGTGERTETRSTVENQDFLFGKDQPEVTASKAGSVRIALGISPPFQKYIFIERSQARVDELNKLRADFRLAKSMSGEVTPIRFFDRWRKQPTGAQRAQRFSSIHTGCKLIGTR